MINFNNEASSSKVICIAIICIFKYFITKAYYQYSVIMDHWVNLDCTEGIKRNIYKTL